MHDHGSPTILEFLNEALAAELTAINQYVAHSQRCENRGWQRLAHTYREESFEEMRDSEHLINRILPLDDMPQVAPSALAGSDLTGRLGPGRVRAPAEPDPTRPPGGADRSNRPGSGGGRRSTQPS